MKSWTLKTASFRSGGESGACYCVAVLETLRQAATPTLAAPRCGSMSRKDKAEKEGERALGWKDARNSWGLLASRQWNQTDSKDGCQVVHDMNVFRELTPPPIFFHRLTR
jgi:hypothetical protein